MFDKCNVTNVFVGALNGRWVHGVCGFVLKFASELDVAHFHAVLLHWTRILVFPDDEVAAFNCALALLLRHSLVDLYRCHWSCSLLPEKRELSRVESSDSLDAFGGCQAKVPEVGGSALAIWSPCGGVSAKGSCSPDKARSVGQLLVLKHWTRDVWKAASPAWGSFLGHFFEEAFGMHHQPMFSCCKWGMESAQNTMRFSGSWHSTQVIFHSPSCGESGTASWWLAGEWWLRSALSCSTGSRMSWSRWSRPQLVQLLPGPFVYFCIILCLLLPWKIHPTPLLYLRDPKSEASPATWVLPLIFCCGFCPQSQ